MRKAIVESCDTYFYGLAQDLGIDMIHEFISQFRLGKRTGIDMAGEVSGLLPSREWKEQRFDQRWFVGDTISVGIGQGYNLVTPLQLASATAVLANGGRIFRPYLVQKIEHSQTNETETVEPSLLAEVPLQPRHLDLVRNAMVDVTRPGGTAARAGWGAKYSFAGKTGTAQVIGLKGEKYDEDAIHERHRDHALFIAFAPAEAPKIALGILVENGGHGSSTAAPIARKVIDYYLLGIEPKEPAPRPRHQESEGD